MKGWLDNFGKADNANESKVSMSEDFVGLGYNTKGRNYSPAWGGQFKQGGIIPSAQTGKFVPISLTEKVQQAVQPTVKPTVTVPYLQTKDPKEFYKSWIQSPEYERRLKATGYGDLPDKWLDGKDVGGVDYTKQQRLDLLENIQPFEYNKYKKSEAKPFDIGGPTININPLDYEGSARQSIEAHEIAHVGTPTMSYQESEIIRNAMLPMKEPVLSGVQGSKERDASKRALEDFKHLQDPDEAKADLDALRFMMYDKGVYDITKGQKFTETDFEKAKQNLGKDRVFKRLTDRMGKKNFVNLMNTIASADQEEAPIAMGGMSIPGSVGFSYARVAGAAPSKGKYAKKTMASAQGGMLINKDETNIDTGVANKIAGLELQQNPDYKHWKYLQSLPQLRQAPGRGEELMRQGLRYADVATDVMQMGNFIPHPTAQAVGKVGNIAGMIVDGLQGADEAYRGNYLNAGINLASVALPLALGSKTFRRPAMNLRPGDPLYSLTEQATKPYVLNLAKSSTDYLELFNKVKKMKDNSLLFNRALLGALGAETVYDVLSQTSSPNVINSSDIEGVYPNFNIELENPKPQPLPTKTESSDPAIAKKLADYMKSKSRENTGEVYGRKSYYPIDGFQNGGEMRFYQNGLDWKPKSMQDGGVEDFVGKATNFVSEGISGPVTTAALALVNMLKPISNPEIYKTVRPVGYPNALRLPVHAYNYLMGNKSEPLKTKGGKPHLAEEFWATAMGMPVEKQYLKESQYKPSKSKDPNAKYYTIRDVIDDYQLMSLTKDLKPGEKMEMNGLSPILDTKWYSQNATTDKGVNFDEIDPLQRYTLEKSPDGSYVSIYDKYDFNNPALNKMMKPIEIYDRFYLPKKKDGGSVNDKKNPKENKDVDTVSISDPRYPELYRNRQVGLKYNDTISLPDLDEVTITAPRSYTMDSLRDFTTAALYGAPATAMKLEAIPQAAMTEGIEMLRGRPYDFSNVNPNIGSFSSNQRDLSQTLGYENPEGFLQNAVNLGLSAIDPLIISGASKVASRQLGKKAVKAVDLDDVAKRKIHLQKLKDEKLIHPDTDINKYSKSLSDTEELTKKALTQRETYYRGVTPKIPEGPEQQLIIEEMTKAGVDISNPEEVGRYMATHVPLQKLDYNAGFQTSNPSHNALYTSGGFSRYGDMTFEMTRPLDFSKGSYSNWLDDLYKYPVYNPSEKIDDLSPFTRAYALENRPGPGVFVGTKGQKIFDDARLVTDDYGRIKSRPLPGLEDAGTINQQGSGSFLQGLINSRMIQNYNPLNLKTNSALDWSKKWYADPITIERRRRTIPEYNQEDKALSLLDQYEPKNYFDLLKEQGLREYVEKSLTTAGISYGKPNQIYVNRSRFIPFNRQRLESTRTHELSHLINENDMDLGFGETEQLVKPFGFIDNSDRIEQLQFLPTNLTKKELKEIRKTHYYTEPGEIKARMDQARFDLDLTPSDKFTSGMFDKILKKNNFYGMGDYIKDKKAFIDLMNNFWAVPAVGVAVGAQAVDQQKNGGITKDNQGYWNPNNWGKPVEIDSNNITMEGVNQPLLGISDTGDTKLMKPGKNYKFKGKKVTEFPVAKLGINQLDAQPMKKLNQLLNFTNNPDKDNWLDKYN